MEEKKCGEKACLTKEEVKDVSGAGGYSGGYCPYTPDRNCKVKRVGNWDPANEDCKYCSYVAW